jgi:F-box interacting protein
MVVIWNSIRKSVGIVVPRLLNDTSEKLTQIGFGVCPSTYDPTIVGMSRFFGMNKTWQVGIFTLSSKTWKMIPSINVPRESVTLRSSTQVVIDRFIFWFAYDTIAANHGVSLLKDLILSFDLITHEFKEIHLPNSLANQFSPIILISKLGESLVVYTYTDEVNGLVHGVWMMGEEGGVMTSVTKLFTINTPDSSIRTLLGFRKSGEPILETVTEDGQFAALEVYEPCSEHINNLGIYGERGSFFICPYTETLLLIDHSDGCIISNDC